ncbi:uncharacterized protein E0L32_008089 [Thyridium curvatum]|uniref:Elongator complex protein 5 n=1 Tax=Thyridium curvatum TaxID=1093900 RepID=A0A507AT15_9PEZI|nr:uncharacterized protein E0L32_008089 [Thyridium curvatum]TPX10883.1 hypothetical protein E0L32_008089 [Thyridium curvatum]
MAPSAQAHGRSHSLLLGQKLLNLRDSASPLTLILDTLEQGAGPLVREFATRAKIGRTKVVFVSFATVRKPRDADVFVRGRGKALGNLRSEIASHCPPPAAAASRDAPAQTQKVLVVIDSLNPLAASHPRSLSAFLSSIVTPAASVVAVYHTDVPLVRPASEYEPHPLDVLCHLATAICRVSSLYQAIEIRRAQNRSLEEPEWGLREGREGVLVGMETDEHGANAHGIVLEMELRRRSGRSVAEKFVLCPGNGKVVGGGLAGTSELSLLSDQPSFRVPTDAGPEGGADDENEADMGATFSLGLTEKQKRDREGVQLPYFDAQTDIGGGEGGRILYDIGREDDFDEDEDEI